MLAVEIQHYFFFLESLSEKPNLPPHLSHFPDVIWTHDIRLWYVIINNRNQSPREERASEKDQCLWFERQIGSDFSILPSCSTQTKLGKHVLPIPWLLLFISKGCHSKAPHTRGLTQQPSIGPRFRRLEVWTQVLARLAPPDCGEEEPVPFLSPNFWWLCGYQLYRKQTPDQALSFPVSCFVEA